MENIVIENYDSIHELANEIYHFLKKSENLVKKDIFIEIDLSELEIAVFNENRKND